MRYRRRRSRWTAGAVALSAAALVTGTLVVNSAVGSAEPSKLSLSYTCEFPLIGLKPVKVDISTDLPGTIATGQWTPEIKIDAISNAGVDAREGLDLVGGRTIKGEARATSTVRTPQGDFSVKVPTTVPSQAIPSSGELILNASGSAPALRFDKPGTATVEVGDLELEMHVYDENGSEIILDEQMKVWPCTQDPGQNNVLHTFQITGTAGGGPIAVGSGNGSLALNYSCALPLIGTKPMSLQVNTALPSTVNVGEWTPQIKIDAVSNAGPDARKGLYLVGGRSIEGVARAVSSVESPQGRLPVKVATVVPKQTIPGAGDLIVNASGTAPALKFDKPGTAHLAVGDIELDMIVRKADGSVVNLNPPPPWKCAQAPGQANVLQTFTIVGDPTPVSPPTVNAQAYEVQQNGTLSVNAPGVLAGATGPEGATLKATAASAPANGTLTVAADGSFTYAPNAGFSGTDTFTYNATATVGDRTSEASAPATATITVKEAPPVPVTPPTVTDKSYDVAEGGTLSVQAPGVLGGATGPEGATLKAKESGGPGNGTLTLAEDGSFTYTPNAGFSGTDSFTYSATATVGDRTSEPSVPGKITITVTDVPDPDPITPPAVTDQNYQTGHGEKLTVQAPGVLNGATGPAGSTLKVAAGNGPNSGTLDLAADGSFSYTPNAGFSGTDTFTYTATATVGDRTSEASAPATVTITVDSPEPDPVVPPKVVDHSFEVEENSLIKVEAPGLLAGATGPDGATVTAAMASLPAKGKVTILPDGGFTYVPQPDFVGTDSFTYTATAKTGDRTSAPSAPATVTITVKAGDVEPPTVEVGYTITGKSYVKAANGTVAIKGTVNAVLDTTSGEYQADLDLKPTSGNFKLFGFWPVTARIEFEQVGKTMGTLSGGALTAHSEMFVKVPSVKMFGYPVAGGPNCKTKESTKVDLKDTAFDPVAGGKLTGTYTLPEFSGCGSLTSWVNAFAAGPGNTLTLNLAATEG